MYIKDLEGKFHADMKSIYILAKNELGYNATRFLQIISQRGGLEGAKQLIKQNGTYGFEILWEHNRLDLSVEAHVLKPEYEELFTYEEREMCRSRLIEYGFSVPIDIV